MRLWHKGDKEDGDKAWHFAEKQYELALQNCAQTILDPI